MCIVYIATYMYSKYQDLSYRVNENAEHALYSYHISYHIISYRIVVSSSVQKKELYNVLPYAYHNLIISYNFIIVFLIIIIIVIIIISSIIINIVV